MMPEIFWQMKGYIMKLSIALAILLGMGTFAMSQETNVSPQRPHGPPIIKCEEMKTCMKAVQNHRKTCEICKTNLPPRGQFGPRDGKGPRGGGRGPMGPPLPENAPQEK